MDNELLQAIGEMMDKKLEPINSRLDRIETEVTKTSITIENDIKPAIQLLAEGHVGLVDRLDRIEANTDKIDDIEDSVAVLRHISFKEKR